MSEESFQFNADIGKYKTWLKQMVSFLSTTYESNN
jgi:hypothetical protein